MSSNLEMRDFRGDEIRLAVLIDADNVSFHHIQAITEEVARYGVPTIKRIYGDWTKSNLAGWKPILLDFAILPVQQFGYTAGKNATDSALIIDAMDILYSERVDGFCLVSSDSDFTPLAMRLREAGKIVFGIGEKKTPNSFIAACDRFIFLDNLRSSQKGNTEDAITWDESVYAAPLSNWNWEPLAKQKQEGQDLLGNLMARAIEAVADEEGWAFLGAIGNMLIKMDPSFDPRTYGYAKLSGLARTMKNIEIDERPIVTKDSKKVVHIYCRLK